MTAQHKEQVAAVLRRAVQQVLTRGLNDPRVRGLVSVTNIKVSDDLAYATVLVSVLPAEHEKLTMQGLCSAAGHLRKEVSRHVRMRRVPRFAFAIDEAFKREQAVLAAITRAAGPSPPPPPDDETGESGNADGANPSPAEQ